MPSLTAAIVKITFFHRLRDDKRMRPRGGSASQGNYFLQVEKLVYECASRLDAWQQVRGLRAEARASQNCGSAVTVQRGQLRRQFVFIRKKAADWTLVV